jgi:hypothetical protein
LFVGGEQAGRRFGEKTEKQMPSQFRGEEKLGPRKLMARLLQMPV